MTSSSFRFGFSYWCWCLRERFQPSAATAAVQRNSLVNDHSPMNCWWLSSLFLLPICCLALEISYEDGQPAECRRDRVASRLFQCSSLNGSNILLNCLGDRIKALRFFAKEDEQVIPKAQKPGDVLIFRLTRDNNTSLEEWNANAAQSNWAFLMQHSSQESVPLSYHETEIRLFSQSPEDIFSINTFSFEPVGFLVETVQDPTKDPCNERSTRRSFNSPQSTGSCEYVNAHPAWTALGTLFVALFSLVAVSTLRRCRRLNRREAWKSCSDPMMIMV